MGTQKSVHHRKTIKRRDFLRFSGLAGSALALASCQGQSTKTAPAAALIQATLNYLGWEGYDAVDADAFKHTDKWMKEHGIVLHSTYIGNNEEMFTKLKAGGPGTYDLATPYVGVLPAWIDADILEPIDTSQLSNFPDLFDDFQTLDSTMKDGIHYAVAFTWSPSVQLYSADRVPRPPKSWMDLLDEKYKGRIVTIDGHDGFLTTMALILGYDDPSPHHLTAEQLAEAKKLGKKFMAQIKTIAPSYGELKNLLVSGEADITMTEWAAIAGWSQAEGVNIQMNIPEEGSHTYVEGYVIPKDPPNRAAAVAFIDHIISPQVQADLAVYASQGVVNKKAVDLLSENAKIWLNYSSLEELLDKAPVYPPIPHKSDVYTTYADWLEAWEELKLGG
ncbi:substrate-binding domain-containing protein [Acidobacteria bacterium AH-259-G07]|nr:substrate-binding domain-containing protein [Acidobacteria bacterium AH-259-G07]